MKKSKAKDKEKDEADDVLLLRHELFIEHYLECFNGTQAWFLSHPELDEENDDDYNLASGSASRLLRNAKIRVELERRFKQLVPSKHEILSRLNDQINATLLPFVRVDDDGHVYFNFKHKEAKKHFHLIKKIKHRKSESFNEKSGETRQEHWVEVELHDAQKALELVGKYYALFTDKTEHTERRKIRVTVNRVDDA